MKDSLSSRIDGAGGASAGTFVSGENITGTGTTFTLAHTPIAGSTELYKGGGRLKEGVADDYTISGATITLAIAKLADEIMIIDYRY